MATSALAVLGGMLLYFTVGDGPFRQAAPKFEWNVIPQIFRFKAFRSAAFGYFGHMWELYAMWAFVPIMLSTFNEMQGTNISIPLWSFLTIAMGGAGCVLGGYFSIKKGSPKVAFAMLLISGIFCLLSPFLFFLPKWLFLLGLLTWGFSVVGDSPQFSAVVAQKAPKVYVGTALTIVNCIGFALTIFSIQLLSFLQNRMAPEWWYLFLLPGPVFGLAHIGRLVGK